MGIFKRHPLLFAFLAFVFISLPSAIDAYWSLSEKFRDVDMPSLNLGILTWLLPILGIALFGFVFWQVRKAPKQVCDTGREHLGGVLISMINADKAESSLIVEPKRVNFEHLRDRSGPYLVFEYWVYNASLCTIKFEQPPTGHVLYKGQELKDILEFLPGGLKPTLKRTGSARITLRQFLLPEVAIEISNTKSSEYVELDFGMVQLKIDIICPTPVSVRTWNFPFQRKLTFKLPLDGKVAFLS